LLWFGLFEGWEEAPPISGGEYSVSDWSPSVSREDYMAAIERIRGYIRAGDTYQVNHTFRLRSRFEGDDRAFYSDLLQAQRAAHCAYLDMGRYRVLSASPEMFVSLQGNRLVTKPMKGTASRGRTLDEDRERTTALIASAKERAENAMIVDLLRNDMGRISEASSVHVTRLFETERYETVWQLTSTIESLLKAGTELPQLMGALFPSGSVTGAPKVRSMEITAELEDSPRGVYTGAVGWVAPASERERMRFNVAIRTVVLDTATGTAEFGVGSGITHDSSAEREYEECVTKALVLTERRPHFQILEAILCEDGEVLWPEAHLDRMAASASYFDFRFDQNAALKAIDSVRSQEGAQKIRLMLSRDGAVTAISEPVGSRDPVDVVIDETGSVDQNDPFLFHKTTRREVYEEAARRHPEAGDVILTNQKGEVTEATSANVIALLDGRWVTPTLSCGLLPGVHRRMLIGSGDLHEAVLTPDDLRRADEVVLLSSVRMRRSARLMLEV
ncbi:MAG: aminodeoxychorismate synthase component I, partial [Actinobacteria bacterium]|nr:aminodeoxychorismate synthase component I [Actinomycetota bacterium]